ncbi:Uncharacterised protein g5356 [Pycnogonum litorale]
MVRARKDSEGSHVEQYRKQIGKQDDKKSKAEMKEIKRSAESRKNELSKYKEVLLMLVAVTVVVLAVYVILYMIIVPSSPEQKTTYFPKDK